MAKSAKKTELFFKRVVEGDVYYKCKNPNGTMIVAAWKCKENWSFLWKSNSEICLLKCQKSKRDN